MKSHGIRGAALALTGGTRLLYAQGYTLAEAKYSSVKPTTLFRLASCSKSFAAVAAWKLIQDDKSFTLDTTVQDVMGLTRSQAALAPASPRCAFAIFWR